MADAERPLSPFELAAIRTLLPIDRAGYKHYHEFAITSFVVGEGRWGVGDIILSHKFSEIDRTAGMKPVIAYGEFKLSNGDLITVSIHAPEDDQMEVQFSQDMSEADPQTILSSWTYSSWQPGRSIFELGVVREIPLKGMDQKVRYVFAIAAERGALWIYHADSGFNQLLAVTGFYEYLLRSQPVTESKATNSPKFFFAHLDEFLDETLVSALLHYNDENRKFDASMIDRGTKKPISGLKRILQSLKRSHA